MEVKILNINRIINLFYYITEKRKILKHKIFNKFINNYKHYPNISKCLDNVYNDSFSYIETLYRLINNIDHKPICPICGNKINISINSHIYFPKTCSNKCSKQLTNIKSKETKLKLYNNQSYNNSNKRFNTCIEKYGSYTLFKTEYFKEKSKETCLKKYDVEYNLQIKDIHDKGIKRSQDNDIKEKRNKTILEKYGVTNVSQSNIIKNKKEETFLKHYGVKNNFNRPEIQNKCNSQISREKMYKTKKKNNTFNSSSLENKSYLILKEKYTDVIRQYKSKKYPFTCDFYIPSKDLYIECNYHWTHGGKPYEGTKEDIEIINKWKNKNTNYYNNAINCWTIRDVNKRNIAKQNNLNYLVFYNINKFIQWINE